MDNFWENPKHNAMRNMLRLVSEIENQGIPVGTSPSPPRPYHRGIYKYTGRLFDLIGKSKDSVMEMPDLNMPQECFMSIVYLSLCWYVVRFGLPLQSESLSQAVLRRIESAYSKNLDVDIAMFDNSFDKLIEKSGQNLVCFDSISIIGRHFGIRDFQTLYHRFMGYYCREDIDMLDTREKFLTN